MCQHCERLVVDNGHLASIFHLFPLTWGQLCSPTLCLLPGAWFMKYNKLIQFLMRPSSPPSHVYIHWSLPWVYTLSVKISLLVVPGGVQFVNTDYKSWPDFILVYNDGKTEDQCPLYGHVNCLCVFRLLELITCETLTLHLLPCGRPWTLWGRGARGVQGTGKFFFHFPFNLCSKMSFSWNFPIYQFFCLLSIFIKQKSFIILNDLLCSKASGLVI